METLPLMNNEPRIPSQASHELETKGEIIFRHPGYRGPTNALLVLAKSDCEDRGSTIVFGLHHRTALLACQIIANNAFNSGYFALDSAGFKRANVPLDGLLTEREYYFFVDGIGQYPVIPTFRDWMFPHNDVENLWPTTPESDPGYPTRCAMSGNTYAINGAHIVPREEAVWYRNNAMSTYADMDNSKNIISLRKDLHKCFDDRWFVIIPKPAPSGVHYVTHILSPSAAEIWPSYHNVEIRCLSQIHTKKFLFARFAWAILQGVKPFLTAGFKRKIIRVEFTETGEFIQKESDMEGSKLLESYDGGGSKSATPLKRKHQRISENDDFEDLSSDESTTDADSFGI
ncbi:hypothetical protein HDV63DRAFT_383525 [Trichoderma sp. SZMC 28014]